MSLRHAGSPVEQPEKLSRAKQDTLLLTAVMSVRLASRRHRCPSCGSRVVIGETHQEMTEGVRKALRLDDPVLDDIIAGARRSGTPLQWSDNRSRENA